MILERAGINTSRSTLKTDTVSLKESPSDPKPKSSIIRYNIIYLCSNSTPVPRPIIYCHQQH